MMTMAQMRSLQIWQQVLWMGSICTDLILHCGPLGLYSFLAGAGKGNCQLVTR